MNRIFNNKYNIIHSIQSCEDGAFNKGSLYENVTYDWYCYNLIIHINQVYQTLVTQEVLLCQLQKQTKYSMFDEIYNLNIKKLEELNNLKEQIYEKNIANNKRYSSYDYVCNNIRKTKNKIKNLKMKRDRLIDAVMNELSVYLYKIYE